MLKRIEEVIINHFNKYPQMMVQDMIKLIYQNEFASGHLIRNVSESLHRLHTEVEGITVSDYDANISLFDEIGNGLVRLNLNSIKDYQIELETINSFFVLTSKAFKGTIDSFERKLKVLRQLCEEGKLPFTVYEVDENIQDLKAQNYPPVSHSDVYRRAYNPSYRVVLAELRTFFKLFSSIDSLLRTKETVNIAIDGNSGAGKSTLAELIGNVYDCNIFHMDDYFLTPVLRTPERLNEPGGNVDYVRFRSEILDKIKNGETFRYLKYNCSKETFEEVAVLPKKLNIIEGCYSMHPYLINDYDLTVFLQIDKAKQRKRIMERNGAIMLERFVNEWIPLEDKYFEELLIPEKSDLIYKI